MIRLVLALSALLLLLPSWAAAQFANTHCYGPICSTSSGITSGTTTITGCGANQVPYQNTSSAVVDCHSGFAFVESTGKLTLATVTTGELLLLGNTSSLSTATPVRLNLGGTFADTVVASKAKLRLYDDGSSIWGIGPSSGQINFFMGTGASGPLLTLQSSGNLDLVAGQLYGSGTAPAVSACGTTPTITGSDVAGKVTTGTGTVTSCTVTFAAAYAVAPACMVNNETTSQVMTAATSTTVLTITGADFNADVIAYLCIAGR